MQTYSTGGIVVIQSSNMCILYRYLSAEIRFRAIAYFIGKRTTRNQHACMYKPTPASRRRDCHNHHVAHMWHRMINGSRLVFRTEEVKGLIALHYDCMPNEIIAIVLASNVRVCVCVKAAQKQQRCINHILPPIMLLTKSHTHTMQYTMRYTMTPSQIGQIDVNICVFPAKQTNRLCSVGGEGGGRRGAAA